MDHISILIAEPDPIRREGLAACLERESDLRLVGTGRDYVEACKSASSTTSIDVMLLNLDSPRMASLRDWFLLRALLPDVRIAGLTEGQDDRVLEAALAGGVVALQQLQADPEVISRAARCAAEGLSDIDPDLMERLRVVLMQPAAEESTHGEARDLAGNPSGKPEGRRADQDSSVKQTPADIERLSPREMQVLVLIARGLDNKRIASELSVSVSTIKFHIGNIYAKMGVRSRVQAAMVGMDQGWLTQN